MDEEEDEGVGRGRAVLLLDTAALLLLLTLFVALLLMLLLTAAELLLLLNLLLELLLELLLLLLLGGLGRAVLLLGRAAVDEDELELLLLRLSTPVEEDEEDRAQLRTKSYSNAAPLHVIPGVLQREPEQPGSPSVLLPLDVYEYQPFVQSGVFHCLEHRLAAVH